MTRILLEPNIVREGIRSARYQDVEFFFLIAIFYCVANLNLNLYLLVTRSVPNIAKLQKKWGVIISTAVTFLCALIARAIDVNPTEDPEVQLTPLIIVQDSFSCSPRLPTFLAEFLLKQMHFLIGSVIVVMSVTLTLRTMFSISAKATAKTSSASGITGFFREMKRQLRMNKATRLIYIGFIFTALFAVNLFVTVNTVPVLESFKNNADARQECLTQFKAYCGYWGTCVTQYDPKDPCSAHSDCLPDIEYCKENGKCGRCYDCHIQGDGVGGTCPDLRCNIDAKMNNREICAFGNCGQQITSFTANYSSQLTVNEILSGESGCIDCELSKCLTEHGCLDELQDCIDPYIELPGCDCQLGCAISKSADLNDIQTVRSCFFNLSTLDFRPESHDCRESLLAKGFDPEDVMIGNEQRNRCCFETSPQEGVEQADGSTIPICPLEDEIPNSFMIAGFVSMNCIPIVGPLVFATSSSWMTAWKKMWRRANNKIGTGTVLSSGPSSANAS